MMTEYSLDIDDVGAVEHSDLHALVGDLIEVLHERHRHMTQIITPGSERPDLPQMQPNLIAAPLVTLQGPPPSQLSQLTMSRRDRLAKHPGDFGQGEHRVSRRKTVQDCERPLGTRHPRPSRYHEGPHNPDSLPQDGNPSSPADLAGDPCRRGRPPLPACAGVLVRPHVFPAPKGFSCQTRWLHGAPRLRLSERARRA